MRTKEDEKIKCVERSMPIYRKFSHQAPLGKKINNDVEMPLCWSRAPNDMRSGHCILADKRWELNEAENVLRKTNLTRVSKKRLANLQSV